MTLMVNVMQADRKSRLAAIRLLSMTLRLMENWRRLVDDHDSAMILIAVAVINFEKLTRTKAEPELLDIRKVVSGDMLPMCNLSSIALATGLNRETVRRKVGRLVERGFLVRRSDGSIHFSPDYGDRDATVRVLRAQLQTFARTANELLREGVLHLRPADSPGAPSGSAEQTRLGVSGPANALAPLSDPIVVNTSRCNTEQSHPGDDDVRD